MTDEFSDERIREEISAYLRRYSRAKPPRLHPEDIMLTRWHLFEGDITRCIESRTEGVRHEPGTVDVSDRPIYDVIKQYPLDPPKKPLNKSFELVKRGTVHRRACDCGNGRRQCASCAGKRYRPCEPTEVCSVCEGVTACTQYLKHGGSPTERPSRLRKPGPTGPEEGRVTCEGCGTPESACPGCRGWGRVRCSDCKATGRAACAPCGGGGTTPCDTCAGQGTLTTWTGGLIRWRSVSHPVPPPEKRPQPVQSELDTSKWQEVDLGTGEPLPDGLSPTERAALEPLLRPPANLQAHEREVARQVGIRRITVTKGEPVGPHSREFYVLPGPDGRLRVIGRLTRQAKQKAMAVGVAVFAVVVLLLFLVR